MNVLDCKGMACPMPIVSVARAMRSLTPGQQLIVEADDPAFRVDLEAWVAKLGHTLEEFTHGSVQRAIVRKGPR